MQYDTLIETIADYVSSPPVFSPLAYQTASWCLMDALGCAALARTFPAANRLTGPWVPGATCEPGVQVMGAELPLDPVKAAFDYGLLIRWLDYNDTWLAKEWGHPSDNLGAILSVIHYQTITKIKQYTVKDILDAMIKAYEIQGILALNNAFNEAGLDHVILVKLASAAVDMHLLGGTREQICAVISQVFVDGQALRTYRHAPNTGSRKSWAAGDACARAVSLSYCVLKGERGYPSALTAKTWGFQDALNRGRVVTLAQPLVSYVMEHILFKVSYPAEFHAQTAVEAAIRIHPQIKDRWDEIASVTIDTQAAGARIIDKSGPLNNPADRDHCLQYMVAVALLQGDLKAEYYEDDFASGDPRIDALRACMTVREDPAFTQAYFDPERRAIPNRLTVTFKNGHALAPIQVAEPLGHRSRREESKNALFNKALHNFEAYYAPEQASELQRFFTDPQLSSRTAATLFKNLEKPR